MAWLCQPAFPDCFACAHHRRTRCCVLLFGQACVCICLHKCIYLNKCVCRPCELFRGIIASSVSRARITAFGGVSMFYDMLWIIPLIYPSSCSSAPTLSRSICPLHRAWSHCLFPPPLLSSTTCCVCGCMCVPVLWSLAIIPQQWNLDAVQRSGWDSMNYEHDKYEAFQLILKKLKLPFPPSPAPLFFLLSFCFNLLSSRLLLFPVLIPLLLTFSLRPLHDLLPLMPYFQTMILYIARKWNFL